MSAEISFQQKDFLSEVRQSFSKLRHEKSLCDITLMSEDDIFFKAHKVVLSSFSIFFQKLLTNHDYQNQLIYLSNIHSSQLSSIMDFIYNGEVKIEQNCLDTFLSNSKTLKVKGLYKEEDQSKENHVALKKEYNEEQIRVMEKVIKKEKDVIEMIDDEAQKESEMLLQDDLSVHTENLSEDEHSDEYGTIKYECSHCRMVFITKEEILDHRLDCKETSDLPVHKTYGRKPLPFVLDERREKFIMRSELFYYLGARNYPKNFIRNRFQKCSKKVPTVVEANDLIERGILSSQDKSIVFYLESDVNDVLQGFKHKRYDMGTEFHIYDFYFTKLAEVSSLEDGKVEEERYFQESGESRFHNRHASNSYYSTPYYKPYPNWR